MMRMVSCRAKNTKLTAISQTGIPVLRRRRRRNISSKMKLMKMFTEMATIQPRTTISEVRALSGNCGIH